MEEVLKKDVIDNSLPLEVTFTGVTSESYLQVRARKIMRGPRWQFLGSIRREIRDRLFLEQTNKLLVLEDLAALENQHYFGAGLFFAKFTLQPWLELENESCFGN